MQDFLTRLLPTIEHFTLLGYWFVLLISLAESLAFVGILVPGTTIIVMAGFFASKGAFDIGDALARKVTSEVDAFIYGSAD